MTTPDLKIIGSRIRDLRKRTGQTQLQLAELLGMVQSSVSALENGDIRPDLDALQTLSAHFRVSIDYLVNGGEFITGDLTDPERDLLRAFRQIDARNRDAILLITTNALQCQC
jgi:transcriptional regulator with XRE-family HTH domain